jgi:hypothetical protein
MSDDKAPTPTPETPPALEPPADESPFELPPLDTVDRGEKPSYREIRGGD